MAVVSAHQKGSDTWLTMQDLWQAAWPNEKAGEHATRNRVHVALAFLRSAGLRPWLRSSPKGYALAPELKVELS
jgi:hypothetical protein